MKKAYLMIILVWASALILPALSSAEIREGSIEFNPFVGYCTGATSHDLCHKDVYGLRLGYALTPNWEIEGAFEGVGSSAATMYHADVLYHFMPEKSFNPFLLAGAGGAHIRPERGSSYNTVMGNIGVGFKYWLAKNIAFRTEIRDVMTHSQNSVVSAGFTFAFGGKTLKSVSEMPSATSAPQPAPIKKIESSATVPAPTPALTPAPRAEAKPAPVPISAPIKVILEDIHYGFGKAILTPAAKEILNKNIQLIEENPGIRVQIEGHTCAHGTAKYNMMLSKKRASIVKRYLLEHGISADRLTVIAYGSTKLVEPEIPTKKNKNSEEAKANRRVHFKVLVK